ncbi:hypothetical protein D910_04198 [Dendroctonus ponderosae]|uniref:Arrestin C-terminal-like domain-containing protein n=1 Tax=Dendroctonus ponderosae TaxID=77166 RepID=U4U378_DENPD|nr:hypothetical protein D910_04198 [Dendroctonus ponderosae]KAH1003385.1 hypothetical protein HUJ05_011309 [Dendroctonus ponderosae]
MPHQCKLILDNYMGHYVPGAPIQGRVLLNLDTDTNLRGVRVELHCKEQTSWLGTESYYDSEAREHKSRDTQFRGDWEVFGANEWLYGDGHTSTTLSVGQHIYPFQLGLQQNIPGSYQCESGSVSYKLVATVDRPMAFDYQDEMLVMVQSPVDLRFIARPEDMMPVTLSDEKSVCCWCCAQGPISMDLELPKATLVPGEELEIKMHLINMSSTNVEGVSLQLTQLITYKVTEPGRDERQDSSKLVELNDVGLGAHGEHTYVFRVALPPTAVLPNFVQCRLFAVEYFYKAVAKLPSVHNNLEVRLAPKVGHIPLGWNGGPAPSAPPKELEAARPYEQPAPPSYDSLN